MGRERGVRPGVDRIWWDGDTAVAGGSEVVSFFFLPMYLWYWNIFPV